VSRLPEAAVSLQQKHRFQLYQKRCFLIVILLAASGAAPPRKMLQEVFPGNGR
jgi:hypothetical protein